MSFGLLNDVVSELPVIRTEQSVKLDTLKNLDEKAYLYLCRLMKYADLGFKGLEN